MANLEHQVRNLEEKNKQLVEELSFKEEQLVVYKVEIQSHQEKLKLKTEEVTSIRNLVYLFINNHF